MRRYAVITAATAAAVIGAGTAFGSAQQNDPGTPTPSPVPASALKDTLLTKCEQSADQIRREHPDAYVSDCNYGEGSVTVP